MPTRRLALFTGLLIVVVVEVLALLAPTARVPDSGGRQSAQLASANDSADGKPVAASPVVVKEGKAFVSKTSGMRLVLIPAGTFSMGSPESEKDRSPDEVRHEVTISKPFYLGVYTITRGQFRQFVNDTGYKTEAEADGKGGFGWNAAMRDLKYDAKYSWRDPGFEQTDEHPVVIVSWKDAVKYAEWLGSKDGQTYRLPTEAEWEYACRAGSTTKFYFGDDDEELVHYGNLADASFRQASGKTYGTKEDDGFAFTAPVGRFQPNGFGLYDMYGNACQWCADWYGEYPHGAVTDPVGPASGQSRVFRSGGWRSVAAYCRSALRHWIPPQTRFSYLGFRLVRVVPAGE
jgi:formylglycine-generating enzyme required for sulfatase activity